MHSHVQSWALLPTLWAHGLDPCPSMPILSIAILFSYKYRHIFWERAWTDNHLSARALTLTVRVRLPLPPPPLPEADMSLQSNPSRVFC